MTNLNSSIEWTDTTWSPTVGCTKVSAGCDNCYAEGIARRFAGSKAFPNGFDLTLHPQRLTDPLRWRKPRRVFVNSMSDLFHAEIPDRFIADVFAVMAITPRHTYQILTKRPGRMRSLLRSSKFFDLVAAAVQVRGEVYARDLVGWPLPNVWMGVSVEDQKWAEVRIPLLLDTPAAVRFLSCEPLLSSVNLFDVLDGECDEAGPGVIHRSYSERTDYGTGIEYDCEHQAGLDWVIVGGESGAGARPMHPQWARYLRDQCQTVGVPFFYKQHGAWVEVDNPTHYVTDDGALHDVHTASGIGCLNPVPVRRLGKGGAGRVLDGRTWDEYPTPAAAR